MEAWSTVDQPSQLARIAQARALSRVGLVDRAWARIQGLIDEEGATEESYAATAELFLTRRWPKRAREVLHRGLRAFPEHQGLKDLWDRLSEPLTTPDLDAVDDAAADVPALITAAHHLIASGSHTRARTLLERAQRQDPANLQVDDMLWALDGDFSVDATLHELVTRYGPDLGALADLDDEPEHTESVNMADLALPEERDKGGSFPNLFREQDPLTEMIPEGLFDDGSEEITRVSAMLDIGTLDTIVDQTFTGEHTEIQRVISRASLVEAASSETAFDLKALRSDLAAPELEDDELVVMTRRDYEDTTGPSGESSLLVLDRTESEPPPTDRRTGDEAETWILPRNDGDATARKDAPKKEVAKKDAPKKEAAKKDPPRKEAGKKDAAKKDAAKKEDPKKETSRKADDAAKRTPAPVQRVEAPSDPDNFDDVYRPRDRAPMWLAAGLAVFALGFFLLLVVVGVQWLTG